MPRQTLEERFWSKVDRRGPDECWEWTAGRVNGYGSLWWKNRARLAHRLAYEMLVGSIPDGLQIDHLCRNRACVNPNHMEPVTMRENILRGEGPPAKNARKTHCAQGHELSEENVFIRPGGWRACRMCMRDANRRWRANNPEKMRITRAAYRARRKVRDDLARAALAEWEKQ